MILGIIQARMSSTRLPGKVLRPIHGKPMLQWQIERLRNVPINMLMIATSIESSDDPLVAFCRDMDIACYRGSLNDVLDRVYSAAALFAPSHVVRWTGDCPLIDPIISEWVIELGCNPGVDYASNILYPRTFADGLDTEIMTMAALGKAANEARRPYEREHVTPYIYNHPERFRCIGLQNGRDESAIRWTVDTEEDLATVERMLG